MPRWLWLPALGLKGIFQMSFLEHVTILHGVGVGGGSLVYANTLPTPKDEFFQAPSWGGLADWKRELTPHYATARRMLGATQNPRMTRADELLREVAREIGREEHFHPTEVGVFFGQPGKRVPDPFFGGEGPDRVGCTHCGACMTGCRVGAKNTLDQNYLWLAERRGLRIEPETEVVSVRPRAGGGYVLSTEAPFGPSRPRSFEADRVVFAGGVMGTVPLLLKMRDDPAGLPALSAKVGDFVRTNSEALIGVVSPNPRDDFSQGVSITSIVHTDEHSHLEPVRYAEGSGFFRTMALPHAPGQSLGERLVGTLRGFAGSPLKWARALTARDFGKQALILLYMRTLDGTLSMRLRKSARTGFKLGLHTELDDPAEAPRAFMAEATDLARRVAEKVGGVPMTLLTETLLGVPSTAHILGGSCMGRTAEEGVIDAQHRVFNYDGLYVIDGSAISANPGVNPSLTITALAERAMSFIPPKA